MANEFRYRRRVEFPETDLAGIVHFSNYFRYMEAAEHAFFRSLDLSIHQERDGRIVGWPRVAAECSYLRPLKFEDEFEIHLIVRQKNHRSLTYDFWFSDDRGRQIAKGSIKVACVDYDPETGKMKSIPIPDYISEKIEAAPASEECVET
jgi:YbgC/YbaW family acyl-CoA thioester hydrolase